MVALCDCSFELVDHPPYSPDLAPSDYFLFPKMKQHLAGKQYRTGDEVISAVDDFFEDQDESFYTKGIHTATPMEEVCGSQERLCWKVNGTIGLIQPLHHSQPMNYSAHPRTLRGESYKGVNTIHIYWEAEGYYKL